MKHLLIILSILLLSSPVIGQEIGVLYQYETSSGFVWKTFGNEKLQPKYEGEITNGKSDGFGFMTYPYDGKNIVGEWKNGKEWNTQHQNKDGKIIKKKVNGKWEIQKFVLFRYRKKGIWGWYEDGDENRFLKYEGEIENGKPNGNGTTSRPDGLIYVGEWLNGKYHGQGTETLPDGWKYVGEWKDGKKHGQGTETLPDGDKYVGENKDGDMWNGIKYDKNGNIIGKWVNGVRQ